MKESNYAEAKVVLCKCPSSKKVYGLRIERRGSDWVRTWAFPIDEAKAKREGFDAELTRGTLAPVDGYPGCPYCGTYSLAVCGCQKLFCNTEALHKTSQRLTCPWCGETDEFNLTDIVQVEGGGL
jgi:hypothetical protein